MISNYTGCGNGYDPCSPPLDVFALGARTADQNSFAAWFDYFPGIPIGTAPFPGTANPDDPFLLSVDVVSGTPDPITLPVPTILAYEDPIPPAAETFLPPAPLVPPSVERAQIPDQTTGLISVETPMALDNFMGIDFPSARDVLGGALSLASQFLEAPTGQTSSTQALSLRVPAQVCPTQGTHPRKQPRKLVYKSIETSCVKNRHMNSLNPHALRRATRRLNGFMHHVASAEKAIRHALGRSLPHRRAPSTGRRGGCVQCGRSARACVC